MNTSFAAALACLAISAAPALAGGCPANAPKMGWNIQSGDQRVSGDYLQNLLTGKKVKYGSEGTEVYKTDGSYAYLAGGKSYAAPAFRFYANGTRCIDYSSPRFDLYVVRDKKLVLLNAQGNRLAGQVTK
ncbi:hypothetical protein AB0T83_03575 [Fluviibacterium sp. DFM31]|uniref:Lipoprotein n=1 Tax=Meridianimarinicoccus marinus TaxID=3231483 RepID=A0ABV3L2Q6_9RHOB